MEKIKELTEDQLKEITKEGRTVLEFSADWCPDCKFLAPLCLKLKKIFLMQNSTKLTATVQLTQQKN